MNFQAVHIYTNTTNRNLNVLLLLIPSLIFAIVISIYIFSLRTDEPEIASTNEPQVLGEEEGGLDK